MDTVEKKIILVDQDGVLADFETGNKFCGCEIQSQIALITIMINAIFY